VNNEPRYITGHYKYYIKIDLLHEGIDPETVEKYHIKWHTLHVKHIDGSVTKHKLPDLTWEHEDMDTNCPSGLEVVNEEYEDAEFPNLIPHSKWSKNEHDYY